MGREDSVTTKVCLAACRRTVRKAYGFPSTAPPLILRLSLRKDLLASATERHSLSALCGGKPQSIYLAVEFSPC